LDPVAEIGGAFERRPSSAGAEGADERPLKAAELLRRLAQIALEESEGGMTLVLGGKFIARPGTGDHASCCSKKVIASTKMAG
jgi:hypothetical protein